MVRFDLWFMPIRLELPMYGSTIFPKMLEVGEEIAHDVLMPRCTLAIGSTAAEHIAIGARRAGRRIVVIMQSAAALRWARRQSHGPRGRCEKWLCISYT